MFNFVALLWSGRVWIVQKSSGMLKRGSYFDSDMSLSRIACFA